MAAARSSNTTARIALLGSAACALAALVTSGVVLVHRASGVANLAAGALGAITTAVRDLRRSGLDVRDSLEVRDR